MRGKTKKDVLTTGEIARLCNVAPRTVAKWFDSGDLRGYRIPGSRDRRVPVQQLIRFMREHGMPLDELEGGPLRILVVDADLATSRTIENHLTASGHRQVLAADSVFEAGILLERSRPHVLVVNLSTPGVDAEAMVRAVGAGDSAPRVRLIGYGLGVGPTGDPPDAAEVSGFDAVLPLPLDFDRLAFLCEGRTPTGN